jgi:uroporphyrin-III C-methyltransferase/precorrin-2 dehydrogenase/sirohydrochlorin ferrochelatase
MSGFVSLVGAGPGDPDLLTVRAARALREADVVFYDALVSPETLALCEEAQRFSVGKRCGRPQIRQETIHALLIRAARRGKRVVRLKGGDPFVFGRGGEEALALRAAGVPFEVVPGVTNAVAAPALAGIPVTHRGTSNAFVVASGHFEEGLPPALGSVRPGSATLVVLMGVATRERLADGLMARGWNASTPAAIVFDAAGKSQSTWRGTLGQLGTAALPEGALPGTIVIGEVVTLGALLAPDAIAEEPARKERYAGA